jgi:hypothetical protein
MKVFQVVILFLCFHFSANSQEMLGIVNSNYAGVYGIGLNPASMIGSRLYMDYNLASFQSSFINNYAFLEPSDYTDYILKGIVPLYYTNENEERNYTIYRSENNYIGYFNQRFLGPSAMIVDGKHAYGISTAVRSNFSVHNLPNEIGVFLYEAIDYDPQHGITYNHDKDIRVGSLVWTEINLSYAYNFKRYKWDSWTVGITIKPLLGTMGTYTNIFNLSYQVHNDDSASVYNTSFEYALSLPVDYNDQDFPRSSLMRGFGFGFDAGIVYAKTTKGHSTNFYSRLCEQKYEAYNYRIGFSIIDVGYIRFTKDAEFKSFSNTHTEWYEPYDTLANNSVDLITAKVDSYFLANADETVSKKNFVMNLPPALSIQYDRAINKYIFVNGTLIYGFNLGESFVKRPSVVVIAPRMETARLEISLPISIVEWNVSKPYVGLSIRYGNFFVGCDKLNPVLGLSDFDSFDAYFGLRLNLSNVLRMNYIKGLCGSQKLRNIEMFDFRNF